MRRLAWLWLVVLACPGSASATASDTSLEPLYTRIAADLARGEPLRVRVYVALCDNDSQGIAPVKNRAICNGDDPARNIYWGTGGGLHGFARKAGYQVATRESFIGGDIAERVTWHKRFSPGVALRQRGVRDPLRVELTGIAYRGARIAVAMHDFVRAVHEDRAPHLVGYIGHDYILDIDSTASLRALARNEIAPAKGVFALSCFGHRYIRPLITRSDASILALNKHLTYPGAWTVGGMIEAIAEGADASGIVKLAAERFAAAMKKSPGAIRRSIAYGP